MLRRFFNDQRGNVAMMFAAAAIPVIGATGAVVDYTFSYQQRAVAQSALDAAALSANRLIGLMPEGKIKEEARKFFLANTAGKLSEQPEIDARITGGSVELTTTLDVQTDFMGIFGIRALEYDLKSVSVAGDATYEVVMVLDNSGSMAGSKIASLQTAAKDLTKVLFEVNHSNPKPDPIKIGVVPFAASVNVGAGYADAGWIDKDAKAPYHTENFDKQVSRLDLFDEIQNVKWQGCVETRPAPYDVTDATPTAAKPATLFVPMFAPDEADTGGYANNYLADDGGSCSFNTGGSGGGGGGGGPGGGHRGGGHSKRGSGGGGSGSGGSGGRASGGGTSIADLTDEQRQALTCKYDGGNLVGEHQNGVRFGPNINCTAVDLQPLTTNRGAIESTLARMKADGMTDIHAGVMWGWRLLSPGEPFAEGRPYDDDENHKIMIVMTDGQNTYTTYKNFNKSMYGAFGYIAKDHLGTTSSTSWQVVEKMNKKTLAACTNAKSGGKILVYTVAFQVRDQATLKMLQDCATRPEMAFRSQSNGELITTFRQIAQEISMLRLAE